MKKQMKKKSVGVAVSIVLASTSLLAACSSTKEGGATAPAPTTPTPAAEAGKYPVSTTETITSWEQINSNLTTFVPNLADSPFGKQLEKDTGIKVKYSHPADGQSKEQFNLLIASNNLTDVIEYDWNNSYPGGPEKAMADKVLLPLNDLIDKHAPNLKKMLQQDKELDKMLKTDSGKYYVFPMIRPDNGLVFRGPMIRKDWLDELGLPVPTTIDEWYTVLKAFKEKKGATAPLTAQYTPSELDIRDAFIGAFRTANRYYIDDQGKVKYGPVDPQFKEALTLLRQWYAEGLLDKDFALNTDSKALDNKILGNASGATVGLLSGGMGRWTDSGKKQDPKFQLVAAPYPTLKKGERAFIGQRDFKFNPAASKGVTTAAKNPELAVKWLDYAYSEKGSLLFNFGIEGESYTIKDGKPTFTDKITKDPKYNLQQMVTQYTKPNGPFPGDSRKSFNTYKEQDEAIKIWEQTDAAKHLLPPFITPTVEESKEVAKMNTAITSYKEEMFVKFVMGKEPLDKFDEYVKRIKEMGSDKVAQIYQNAYDRYNKR
ncbi:putative aldouronate transport system substrate-binding protein [Paenibacillus sp. UNCCL117]|uniref:extracellular solute-binding protein n=1 Tax=unclassified Paenibacillus TaxID=185978 RepID=UPI000885A017|nr:MULTISPECIES: extracellular solute-binding protein [unclassified Paenibacillus]SDD56149.1 putative aldouronate transport system substrate-binding protein [Paenibacillus sp. cl123]SFW51443.1 putative aldouronate transport system substrate-binding protein [Paenibacillus sp. UNCCL117]